MIDERDALLCACNLMVERHTSVQAYVTGRDDASFISSQCHVLLRSLCSSTGSTTCTQYSVLVTEKKEMF
jgi:hypothetical protein